MELNPNTPSNLLNEPHPKITVIPHNPFHPGRWHQVLLPFCVVALHGSQSTRPLINRLELLTGGSSIPDRPCHFHYCISITPHFRDEARKKGENHLLISILIKRPSDNDQSKQSAGRQAAAYRWRRGTVRANIQHKIHWRLQKFWEEVKQERKRVVLNYSEVCELKGKISD